MLGRPSVGAARVGLAPARRVRTELAGGSLRHRDIHVLEGRRAEHELLDHAFALQRLRPHDGICGAVHGNRDEQPAAGLDAGAAERRLRRPPIREHEFEPERYVAAKDRRRMDDFILYAIAAATEAMENSGYRPQSEEEQERAGVMIGSGVGGLPSIAA